MKYLRSYVNLATVLGVALIVGGAAALSLTLLQNSAFGESIADSSHGQILSASGSMIMDSFAAILSMVLGLLLTLRRFGLALVAGLSLVLYLGYSMQSSFGFQMTERMAKAERLRDGAKEAREAVERENAQVLSARESLRADLTRRVAAANAIAGDRRQSRIRREEARAEKKRLDEALTVLATAAPLLKQLPPKPEAILADPQAEILARWVNISPDAVAVMQIGALAVGLPMAKVLGFFLGGILLHIGGARARARLAELEAEALAAAAAKTLATQQAPAPEPETQDVEAELSRSMAEAVAAANDDHAETRSSVSYDESTDRVARAVEDLMDKQQRQVNDIQAYLSMATDFAPTVQVSARQFLNHYKDWARLEGRAPAIGNTVDLGNYLRAAGLGRIDEHNKVYYVGRSLRPLVGEADLDVAA